MWLLHFVVPLVPKPSVVLTHMTESWLSKVFQVASHPRVNPKTFFKTIYCNCQEENTKWKQSTSNHRRQFPPHSMTVAFTPSRSTSVFGQKYWSVQILDVDSNTNL